MTRARARAIVGAEARVMAARAVTEAPAAPAIPAALVAALRPVDRVARRLVDRAALRPVAPEDPTQPAEPGAMTLRGAARAAVATPLAAPVAAWPATIVRMSVCRAANVSSAQPVKIVAATLRCVTPKRTFAS